MATGRGPIEGPRSRTGGGCGGVQTQGILGPDHALSSREAEVRTAPAAVSRTIRPLFLLPATAVLVLSLVPAARAQTTPASGSPAPGDTPSVKVGGLIFADYTYQQTPQAKDAAGNDIHPSSFNLTRAYINVTGNISHIVAFRITPDVTRVSVPGTSLDGSLAYRLKYAYAQFTLDDWLPKGSWVKLGMQQTPFLDSIEGIYRYRFQGTTFTEREGYLVSSDLGVTFRTAFPKNYGDVHVGFYNGEGYTKPEVNNKKAFVARVGFRPLPGHRLLKTWRLQGFWIRDSYMEDAPRNRSMFNTTFEHSYVNAGFDYIATTDKVSSAPTNGVDLFPTLDGRGWSVWATPKKVFPDGSSIEGLIRYDHMKPGGTASATAVTSPDGLNERWIGGVAYWFARVGNVGAALMLDVDSATYSNWSPEKPTQRRIFVHSVISF
jgi:hypothetical protein